jgi:hypothetical protein
MVSHLPKPHIMTQTSPSPSTYANCQSHRVKPRSTSLAIPGGDHQEQEQERCKLQSSEAGSSSEPERLYLGMGWPVSHIHLQAMLPCIP